MNDTAARELAARIDVLLDDVHDVELVQALVALYGEGLTRIAARVPVDELVSDEVVSNLLVMHDLHPLPLRDRVQGALDEVAPYLDSHGGGVELVGIEDGVVHLRLQGTCNGCPSSRTTLELAIEKAIRRAAPDVERIEAEAANPSPPTLLQIELACPVPHA
jgi:Fe-S cluster biogenesis protein NfuA